MNATARVAFAVAALGCGAKPPLPATCLAVDSPTAPVGFDSAFELRARVACPQLSGGRIAWRQLSGARLPELTVAADGFSVTGRTPPLRDLVADPLPWGVVPLSPRTRGEVTLEARWSDGRGRELRREIRVVAAPRSRGLPNAPLGARAYLGGEGWHLVARPDRSTASVEVRGGLASVLPDAAGDYQLADGQGRALTLRAARYDETPLDCGRAGCHAPATEAAARSPMTTVLARGLTPLPGGKAPAFGEGYPGCALPCHTTGEPGLADGGFAHVAAELGVAPDRAVPFEALPRPLRRLGGVGCLACHGPAALPPPAERWTVLRADVCAVCHDAPPRYGHVAAWRGTAMARADRDADARTDPACARCHTTAGFLASIDVPVAHSPAAAAEPFGIACAACHAPHAHETGAPPGALLRAPAVPAALEGAARLDRSQICVRCHAPDGTAAVPGGPAAAIWLARGGVDPASGAPLPGAPIHAGVAGGCVGCHRAGPAGLERGAGHGFAGPPATCTPCHAATTPTSDVADRARRLWSDWLRATGTTAPPNDGRPAHAHRPRVDRASPLGRAGWDVLLVLEDRGAAAHNARYARALLDAAETAIATAGRRR